MRNLNSTTPLLLVSFAAALIYTRAATHYCVNDNAVHLDLDNHYHKDETIVPRIPDEPANRRMSSKLCRWEIDVQDDESLRHQQIVFQGLPIDTVESDSRKNDSKTDLIATFKAVKQLIPTIGMLHVYPLADRRKFIIESNWGPKLQSPPSVMLRVLLPISGYCSRDMLSYRGNCYAIIAVMENFADAVVNLGGTAKLASFIDWTEIDNFIAANYVKQTTFPFRKPLNLREWPLRIGIFSNSIVKPVVDSGSRANKSCRLPNFHVPQSQLVSSVKGVCGSLRIDQSGRAVVEFGDCSRKMMTLVSFPETAAANIDDAAASAAASKAECTGSNLIAEVRQLSSEFQLLMNSDSVINGTKKQEKASDGRKLNSTSVIILGCFVLIFAATLVISSKIQVCKIEFSIFNSRYRPGKPLPIPKSKDNENFI